VLRQPALLLTRAARITLIVLVLLLIAYTVFGFWIVPRMVRSNLVGFASEQYHRAASVGDIRFNPFTLKLELHDFALPDADGAPLLAFRRLLLDFDVSSVWRVGASFADVELDDPFARVMLRPDGSLNLADLAKLAHPSPPSESDATPKVFIDRLSVSSGRIAFEDRARATPFATELRPINFELRDFSTGGQSGNAYSLRGASVDGETFAWSGTFQLTPLTSNGKFEVASLQARTVWSYLREALPFEFTRGVLNLNGEYFYNAGEDGGLRLAVHRVSLTDFGMRPLARDHDYVEVASLAVEDTQVNVRTRRVDIARVTLDGGALHVARDPEGRINLLELAGAPPGPGAAEPAPASTAAAAPPWVVSVPDIAAANLRVDFNDALVKPAASFALTPVNLKLSGFSTAPDTALKFDFDAHGEQAGDLEVSGTTTTKGETYQAHVEVNEFNLAVLQPYLSTYTQITLNSAWLTSALDVQGGAQGAVTAKGDVTVNKLAAIDNTLKQDLLKWERVTVSGIDYGSSSGATPASLKIARIDARAPYARLVIAPDQSLNITQLFTPAPGSAPPAVQTVRDTTDERHAPGGDPGAMRITIGQVKVQGGSANFADYWIKPNYAVSLQELTGSIAGLSSNPKSRARVDLTGRVDRYAPAQISGEMNLLSAALYTDMHVKFDGVEMTSVTPYSGHFAGYEIEKGKLSIDVTYLVDDRQLTAKQKFVIDQLQLGDRVESPDAVKLPLKLAVALLKDRNGVIDIDLPLTGSLDDPQFRVGPLIWKAFIGLLGKIATSPFTLLAKLGGSNEEINQLDFEAGSATLDAAGQERLAALAKALTERPALELELPTVYAPDADGHALAQGRLEARLAAAGAKPDMADSDRFDLLRKQYEKDSGKQPLPAAALTVLEMRKKKGEEIPYAAGIEQLESALREKQPATDTELGDLARARAQAIRDALLGGGQVEAARVYVLGIKPVAAVGGKVRVELALK
jgi:outer membrane protein OmpA-like peptidoglycan-associated protein